jgi:putative nucleotidyltransferase with HDIG domain
MVRKKAETDPVKAKEARAKNLRNRIVKMVSKRVKLPDSEKSGHDQRVAKLAMAIGARLGLDNARQEGLIFAGYLHDIGKVLIPPELIAKPGKLTAIEFEKVKTHAALGFGILDSIDFECPVAETAHQHHEFWDGSGYPQGLKGDQILPEAQIITAADSADAMISKRSYKTSLGIEGTIVEIERCAGKQFNPEVASACLEILRNKEFMISVYGSEELEKQVAK